MGTIPTNFHHQTGGKCKGLGHSDGAPTPWVTNMPRTAIACAYSMHMILWKNLIPQLPTLAIFPPTCSAIVLAAHLRAPTRIPFLPLHHSCTHASLKIVYFTFLITSPSTNNCRYPTLVKFPVSEVTYLSLPIHCATSKRTLR